MTDKTYIETSKLNIMINGVTYTVGIHFKDKGETMQDKMKRLIVHECLYGDDGTRRALERREQS